MKYWLMKTEPLSYSIDDLKRDKVTSWNGVRNYQARNFMRDEMEVGDRVLFYHSNADPSGIAGVAEVCRAGYPDDTAFDVKSKYYDEDASPDNPIWFMVDIRFVEKFKSLIPLEALKANPNLKGMPVIQKGSRLSVQPVSAPHFKNACKMKVS